MGGGAGSEGGSFRPEGKAGHAWESSSTQQCTVTQSGSAQQSHNDSLLCSQYPVLCILSETSTTLQTTLRNPQRALDDEAPEWYAAVHSSAQQYVAVTKENYRYAAAHVPSLWAQARHCWGTPLL